MTLLELLQAYWWAVPRYGGFLLTVAAGVFWAVTGQVSPQFLLLFGGMMGVGEVGSALKELKQVPSSSDKERV